MTAGWNLQWAMRSTAPEKVIVIPDGTLPFPWRRHMFGSSHVCCLEVNKERSIAVTDHRCRQGAHENVTGTVGADQADGECGKRTCFSSAFQAGNASAACSHNDGPETRREPACGGERRRRGGDGDFAQLPRLAGV